MQPPKYTPYDGSRPLFGIGLEPLPDGEWLQVDDQLAFQLSEKDRLTELYPDRVFVEEEGTHEAQAEVLQLIVDELKRSHADTHHFEEGCVRIGARTVSLDSMEPPLRVAAGVVQEDLVLMRKSPEGWRLAAASLCFPSSWSLKQKFGKPMHEIHAPVPGFAQGTRNAMMIERIFDNLLVDQPVRRTNWSVYTDDELFHDNRSADHVRKKDFGGSLFLRVEYQTLHKLPESGDILFTIHIHVDPFEALRQHADRDRIARGFIETLGALNPDQLAYKGMTESRDQLIGRIEELLDERA